MSSNESFDVDGKALHISIALDRIEVGCPFREDEKDIYRIELDYTARGRCLPLGWFRERIKSYGKISGECIAARLVREMIDEINPIVVNVDVKLLNNEDSLTINHRGEGTWDKVERMKSERSFLTLP